MKILVAYPLLERFRSELKRHVQGDPQWTFVDWRLSSRVEAELPDTTVFVGHSLPEAWARIAASLELVHVPGSGTDAIAVEHLPAGTALMTVGGHGRSIAEFVLLSCLSLSRGIRRGDSDLRRGHWWNPIFDPSASLPETLEGKHLLMLGYGEIGRDVVRMLRPAGMRITVLRAHPDRFSKDDLEVIDQQGSLHDLAEHLPSTQFLVLALPLATGTRGIIGRTELGLLSTGSFIVNVGRGQLVEEEALYAELKSGRLGGAALDVWYNYPVTDADAWPSSSPFWELDNVLLSPHASGSTVSTFATRADSISRNIERFRVATLNRRDHERLGANTTVGPGAG